MLIKCVGFPFCELALTYLSVFNFFARGAIYGILVASFSFGCSMKMMISSLHNGRLSFPSSSCSLCVLASLHLSRLAMMRWRLAEIAAPWSLSYPKGNSSLVLPLIGRLHFFKLYLISFLKNLLWGFPGGAVVESPPANAGDTGSGPGLGGSHMPRSDSAREPQLLSLRVWSLCSAAGEAAIVRGPRTAVKSGPCSPQLEEALAQKRRPNASHE